MTGIPAPPPPPPATARGAPTRGARSRGRLTALLLASVFGAIVAVALGTLATRVLEETGALVALLAAAWVALATGYLLHYLDVPRGHGGVPRELGLGLALGLAGMGAMTALMDDAALPWWTLATGAGWGIYRAHAPVLQATRAQGQAPRRIGGILDPREVGALGILVTGYALMGLGAHRVFAAFAGIVPDAGKALSIGVALYALYGARLLLKFASHDAGPTAGGFVGWFKANLLRNAIVVLLLVAYWAYRDDLAEVVPYFPLVEFALGMAVFGAILGRLRWRLRHERSDHATASQARPHVPRADPITEADYEALARPVSRFIESGRGASEYERAVREAARLEAADAANVMAPVRAYRPPHEAPPLPLAWAVGASLAAGALAAIAMITLIIGLATAGDHGGSGPSAELVRGSVMMGLVVAGLAVYRAQDHARAHRRPWVAFGLAAGGTGIVLLVAIIFTRSLPGVPTLVWGIIGIAGALMVGIPLLASWRLDRDMRAGGQITSLAADLPSALLARGLAGARRSAATAALGAVVLLVLVPFVIAWLVKVVGVPEGVQDTYDAIASGAAWALGALGASALVRFWGMSRARPVVVAQERRRREERLRLHSEIMRRLERV